MERFNDDWRQQRRSFSAEFKAAVLEQTREAGVSVSSVALKHGLHPNMVHRWLREQRMARAPAQGQTMPLAAPALIPLVLFPMNLPWIIPGAGPSCVCPFSA